MTELSTAPTAGPRPFCFEVKTYVKRIVIGCADDEQLAAQEVVFDVLAWIAAKAALLVDMRHPEFDYCVLTDAIDAACAAPGIKVLQESLAFDVITRVFAASSQVAELEVATLKTERYANTQGIGFRIRLTRAQCLALQAQIQHLTGTH